MENRVLRSTRPQDTGEPQDPILKELRQMNEQLARLVRETKDSKDLLARLVEIIASAPA